MAMDSLELSEAVAGVMVYLLEETVKVMSTGEASVFVITTVDT